MGLLFETLNQSLMITGFVFVMMLVIEYVNVLTSGTWQKSLARSRWSQYLLAALLGAMPGCLGAFAVVTMYSHRMVSIGAVVAAMIATSGDESFVMLSLIPREALILTGILFVIGAASGFVTDVITVRYGFFRAHLCEALQVHDQEGCECFPRGNILAQWKTLSLFRTVLTLILALFTISVGTGQIGPADWDWVRISLLSVSGLALFIVGTVPDHFLEEHLWKHVARKHVPRIFLWTFGTLLVMEFVVNGLNLGESIQGNLWAVLGIASLVGLIPESGPHLVFVMLYVKGTIPFGILLASSIVQDGHGMLPLLAHSRRDFFIVKLINLGVGLLLGALFVMFGG
ncbi:MAG: putative manganese transporter [Bacteroidota bacterium]